MKKSDLPVKKETERKNKDIVQSHTFTMARYQFNLYEKRILYRTIDLLQQGIYQKGKYNGSVEITLPVASVFPKGGEENYHAAKKALHSLLKKTMEFEDKEKKMWRATTVVIDPEVKRGMMHFQLSQDVCNALSMISQYHRFEIETAISLRSAYSMRFYELFSNQSHPLIYNIDTLREMFQLKDKYKGDASAFIKYVIESSKKELDAKAPYTFHYESIRAKNSKKIQAIRFTPVYQKEHRDKELLEKEEKRERINQVDITQYLIPEEIVAIKKLGITERKLKNNWQLLERVAKARRQGKILISQHLCFYAEGARDPQSYFFAALRKELSGYQKELFEKNPDKDLILFVRDYLFSERGGGYLERKQRISVFQYIHKQGGIKRLHELVEQKKGGLRWEDCTYWRNYFIDKIKSNEPILLEETGTSPSKETTPVLKEATPVAVTTPLIQEKKTKRKPVRMKKNKQAVSLEKSSLKKEEPSIIPTTVAVPPTKFLPVRIEKQETVETKEILPLPLVLVKPEEKKISRMKQFFRIFNIFRLFKKKKL